MLFTLLSFPALGAESLCEIYIKAKASDPVFEGAGYAREAIRESLRQAWGQLLPSLNAVYQYTDTSQEIIASDNQVYEEGDSDYKTKEYSITLKQPLFSYALFLGVSQARVEQTKADLELEAAAQDLIVRVSESYLNALAVQDQLDFARAELAAILQHHELAAARYEMGLAPVTDLHDARARLASRQARVTEAESELADALQAIRELTNDLPEALAPLAPQMEMSLPVPDDIDKWTSAAIQQNLEVEAQRRLVEIAGKEVSRQRSGHYPTLDLLGRFNNQDTDGSLYGGGSEVENQEVILQLTFPILEGGLVYSRTGQAIAQYNRARADLKRLTREAIRQARAAFLGVKSAFSRVNALEQAVESQQLALDAKQEGYRSGLFTSLAVLDAERDLFQAKMELAQARYDYLLNRLKLRRSVGSLGEPDLLLADHCFVGSVAE